MRAMVDREDVDAMFAELLDHPAAVFPELLFAVVAAGNSGLVGDHHDDEADRLGTPCQIEDPVHPFGAVRCMDVSEISIDDAVAIQKKRSAQLFVPHYRSRS